MPNQLTSVQEEKTPYKIFNFCEYFDRAGGVERMLKLWYSTAPTADIMFDFALKNDKNADMNFIDKVCKSGSLFLVNKMQNNYNVFKLTIFYKRLYTVLKKGKYHLFILHQNLPFPILLACCWVAKAANVKKIAILSHSSLLPIPLPVFRKSIFKLLLPWCTTHRLAVSHEAGQALFGKNMPFTILHPGIIPTQFAFNRQIRNKLRRELGLQDQLVIGHVGRLCQEKNHAFLLQVFHLLYRHYPNARLLLVGDGPLRSTLTRQASQFGIAEFVLFAGNQASTSRYYQAMDAFVFPSEAEGLPLALLEAQSSGLPCFVSDTITPEVNICNVTPLSLNLSIQDWVQTILQELKHFQRTDCSSKVKQSGFDIQDSIKKLKQL